jgi:uncharacterized membrane protein
MHSQILKRRKSLEQAQKSEISNEKKRGNRQKQAFAFILLLFSAGFGGCFNVCPVKGE